MTPTFRPVLTAAVFLAVAGLTGCTNTTATAKPAVTVTATEKVPVVVTVAPTPAPKPAATKAPAKQKATIPDGYEVAVGDDVPAGTYTAHSTSSDCYWEIDKHATSDIIDNDEGKQGHLTVKLKAGEDFSSQSCGDWIQQ
jgi:hypothetical protein